MEELEQASSAVEIAKRKVGPATGFGIGCDDSAGALETAHGFPLDERRIEGDVKVVRMRETRFKECSSGEMPPDAAGCAGDGSSRDAFTATSYGGNEASGRGRGGESTESKHRCGEEPKKKLSYGEPEHRGQQHQGPKARLT